MASFRAVWGCASAGSFIGLDVFASSSALSEPAEDADAVVDLVAEKAKRGR